MLSERKDTEQIKRRPCPQLDTPTQNTKMADLVYAVYGV